MPESIQRDAFTHAQLELIHRNLRFLESAVNSPIGLTTDLQSLRAAIEIYGCKEEPDRQAFSDITGRGKDPRTKALMAQKITLQTVDFLTLITSEGDSILPAGWHERARKILTRVNERIGSDIRKEITRLFNGIYVIIDPAHTNKRPPRDIAEAVLSGGAIAVQLRDKLSEPQAILDTAYELNDLCKSAEAVFIMNDFVDLGTIVGSDGVHLGKQDIRIQDARKIMNPRQVIGTSNAFMQEALNSESEGADYLAVGSVFPTITKEQIRRSNLNEIFKIKKTTDIPIIAIGGINAGNITQVAQSGADAACIISAITKADSPEDSTMNLDKLFRTSK